jgi:hypothetical protein
MRRHKAVTSAVIGALLVSALMIGSAGAASSGGDTPLIREIVSRGAAPFRTGGPVTVTNGGAPQSPEIRREAEGGDAPSARQRAPLPSNRSLSPRPDTRSLAPAALIGGIPVVNGSKIASSTPGLVRSFDGLNFFDQRYANNGNQFSVEPPDQALCVGNGYVLESVNTVLRVYSTSGAPRSAVTDLNTFYGYPAQLDRSTGLQGPFITDPVCYYDPDHQRWFHVVLTLDVVPKTGDLTGGNHLDIAVSKTANPLGDWIFYSLPVQNNGDQGTPRHTGCPCIGDYPHIGADRYGFYITTNEYPFSDDPGVFGNNFNGAQLYAMSKEALARGRSQVTVVHFQNLTLPGRVPGFTVWPATSPAGNYATRNNGTEYFLSSVAAVEALNNSGFDRRIGFWALTNTRSLATAQPNPQLQRALLGSEVYGVPPLSEQKIGNVPLRDCLLIDCLQNGERSPQEVEGPLDSNDSRMQQVWYADGRVWGALDTIVYVGGKVQAGIAFFVVRPADTAQQAQIAKQGYLAVDNHNVIYPAVAVLPNGAGVMAFTLVGKDYYPSAAYTSIDRQGTGDVYVARKGAGPEDGFCEYLFYNCAGTTPNPSIRPRWGDYGAAVTDGNRIWIASEYIAHTCTFAQYLADFTCGGTRAALGNWATRISLVQR